MTAAEYRKITCPFCSGHIEFSAKDTGIVVNCPHCAQELVLELPPVPEQRGRRYLPIQKPKPTRSVAILVAVASGGLALLGLVGILARPEQIGVGIVATLLLAAAPLVYFLPALVAEQRCHRNAMAITVTSLFLGWTFLGWVVALVWACTSNVEGQTP